MVSFAPTDCRRIRYVRFLGGLPLLLLLPSACFAQSEYWQLVFTYNVDDLALVEAAEIPPMKKKVASPGLKGAPGTIECQVDWLDAKGGVMTSTVTEIPVGKRGFCDPENPTGPWMPQEGVFVLRIPGPAHGKSTPAAIQLQPIQARRFGMIAVKQHKV
ncbi:MAG: hypothetical protein KC931_26695, partial [Candidatus Omnitrophica bacterium]|nr:hypothetical protein [Candidatus Omnitrophota bacterium]